MNFQFEFRRKSIHIASAVVPLAVWFLPRAAALWLLSGGVLVALVLETLRTRVRWARYVFLSSTRTMLRHHERSRLVGATHMAVAYLIVFLLFSLPVAVAAMLYNALGDAAAAIVGKRWGRHRTSWGKSWEGAAAGALVNLAVGLAIPGLGAGPALAGAVAAAGLEFLPLPLDDNLRVTLGGGAAAAAAAVLL